MTAPTREQIETARIAARSVQLTKPEADALRALCDLATAVLDAPTIALTPEQRATWGACSACGAWHGVHCGNGRYKTAPHDVRMENVPTHFRLVACDGDGT